jgi:Sulfotransferase family
MRREFMTRTHPQLIAHQALERWALALQRTMDFRTRTNEGRFHDIAFRDIVTDPAATIQKLYQWLGWGFSSDIAARIAAWQTANPKGSHKVDSQHYGLEETSVRHPYRFYTEAFAAFI